MILKFRVNKNGFSSGFNLSNMMMQKKPIIDPKINNQHYDVAVIGGGSGGIAFAYEAKKLGLNPILFDYVDPSTQGSKWGLGGTCVNVGCIPKKLFHTAALLNEKNEIKSGFGFSNTEMSKQDQGFDWQKLTSNVQNYIKSNNFGYKQELNNLKIPYVNAFATLQSENSIVFSPEKQQIYDFLEKQEIQNQEKMGQITFDKCLIATGGRPTLLDEDSCEGMKQYAITSDDIFSLKKSPGKTLVVGGGYIALECAGFLKGLGYDVTLMTRGLYLRGMDRQVVDQITHHLDNDMNINIVPTSLPYQIQKTQVDGVEKLRVKWKNQQNQQLKDGEEYFDTVVAAIGRYSNINSLNLQKLNVQLNNQSNKIQGSQKSNQHPEQTSVSSIFAIGDILHGVPELTPVASKSGIQLARKFAMEKQTQQFKSINPVISNVKYDNSVATTVFTPLEYAFIGFSEEEAIKEKGEENLEIYLSKNTPLEQAISEKIDPNTMESIKKKSFFKIICDKNDDQRIIGIHYLGDNAGEIMQGFSVAYNMGMKKSDLDNTVGIHPTIAEEFVNLKISKNSGIEFEKTSC